jgi:hypothetical protein
MTMPQAKSELPTSEPRRRALQLLLGATGVLLVAATLLLWAHYGTAVFLEMIRAGIATCFG